MGIKQRIKEAIDKLAMNDFENALIQTLIALDSTAKKEGLGKKNADRCKKFIDRNRNLITRVSFGLLEFQGPVSLQYDFSGQNTEKSFEEIIYHVIRCSLLHEGTIPAEVEFTKDIKFGVQTDGKILLPERIVFGLIMAVVGSKANENERIGQFYSFNLDDERYYINDFWGDRGKILNLFRHHAKKPI